MPTAVSSRRRSGNSRRAAESLSRSAAHSPFLAGRGLAEAAARRLAPPARGRRVVLLFDRKLPARRIGALARALTRRGAPPRLLPWPGGEKGKTREGKARLEDRLLSLGCGRDTFLIVAGGGSLLDLGGFTAATFARGIPWAALPTTLLAMADAAIGGKTAVNTPAGKNLIGAHHPPVTVIADLAYLDTQSVSARADGLAEIIKIAVARSPALFRRLERVGRRGLDPRGRILAALIAEAVRLKQQVVGVDEREAGPRRALNLGHTLAHALEGEFPGGISHGQAVSIGLVAACRIAEAVTGFGPSGTARVEEALRRAGLPVRLPAGSDPAALLRRARADKKAAGGRPRWVLPSRIGTLDPCGGIWARVVPEPVVRSVLDSMAAADR